MKTKQATIKAKLPLKISDMDKAYCHDKETFAGYKIIDKKTEKTVIDCRFSQGRSRNASSVYCDLWVSCIKGSKIPKKADYTYIPDWCEAKTPRPQRELSGNGVAGGWGYDKKSSALGAAIESCGITLWGTPYHSQAGNVNFKKRAHIGGTGVCEAPLLSIAHAIGYNSVILVSY